VGWCWADGGNVWLTQQDPRIRQESHLSTVQLSTPTNDGAAV
jgi:hypothetical protein